MDAEHPRLVSLVPSWTETLFSFGFDAEVVGVTRWCVHPRELVERIEKVGGTKDPDVARILALRPSLVVCEKEENRREDVEALRAGGLDVFVSDVQDLASMRRDVLRLSDAVGRPEAGRALAERLEASEREVIKTRPPRPVPAYVPIWRSPWMGVAKGTYADAVLALAGVPSVFHDEEERYPERSPEEAIEAGARVALLPTEPYPFHKMPQAIDELAEAGFPRERIRVIDGEALTWYGARAVEGLRAIGAEARAVAS